jgi:hypothetical protein
MLLCTTGFLYAQEQPVLEPGRIHILNAAKLVPALLNLTLHLVASFIAAFLIARCSYADCDKNTTNGCEVNTLTDISNCGACGQAATLSNANATCSSGVATISNCLTG